MLVILCGKSSCGKDTLEKMLKQSGFEPIVSTTTRPMREGEVEGREYYFVSREQFLAKLDAGQMLEYRSYDTTVGGVPDTWYYGNEYRELDAAKAYVTILDLEGAKAFRKAYGDQCFVVYIQAGDAQRTEWAKMRGSFDSQEWHRRMLADKEDFAMNKVSEVCDQIIVNDKDVNTLLGKFTRAYQDHFVK